MFRAVLMADNERQIRYTNEGVDLPTVYTNNIEVAVSTWDVRLRLGQIQELINDKELSVKNVLTVYMSLEHAKILVDRLSESLRKWDVMNAEIQARKP